MRIMVVRSIGCLVRVTNGVDLCVGLCACSLNSRQNDVTLQEQIKPLV